MPTVNFDTRSFNKTMRNAVAYSMGFVDGVESSKMKFNAELAAYTKVALYKYIDVRAKADPTSLHHIYEPGMVGSEQGRLFEFDAMPAVNKIIFQGRFLPSTRVPNNGGDPFTDRANIMENQIGIVIAPKNADFLAFEDDGEMVFTTKTIYIAHPGGDAVAGSFGKTIDTFFSNYFTNAILAPIMNKLQQPTEYSQSFARGASGGGKSLGFKVGRNYLDVIGEIS